MSSDTIKKRRICIYAYDIEAILGVSIYTSRRMIQAIRKKYNLPERSRVSLEHFCRYSGYEIAVVRRALFETPPNP